MVALLGPLAGCASSGQPGPAERMASRLAEFERHAGPPIEDFHFWQMDRWEALGPLDLAVWTNPSEAYLITVKRPCPGLDFAGGIGLTSMQHRVYRRFDFVTFESQRCPIASIRAVDGKALKAERRERSDRD